jgi:hypothetical protein
MGVFVGLVDTDMAKFTDYPKSDPADVVRQVLNGTVKLIGGLGDSGLSFACCA